MKETFQSDGKKKCGCVWKDKKRQKKKKEREQGRMTQSLKRARKENE